MGHDVAVLAGTDLSVAGVDDEVGVVLGGGTDLDGRAERGAPAAGKAGLVEPLEQASLLLDPPAVCREAHDHSWAAIAHDESRRRRRT
jgi:hypothetical protein